MTEETNQIEVPNLAATSDGKAYSHRNNGSRDLDSTQKRIQDRHCRIDTGILYNTKRLDRKRK